jgi:hypothetical protein
MPRIELTGVVVYPMGPTTRALQLDDPAEAARFRDWWAEQAISEGGRLSGSSYHLVLQDRPPIDVSKLAIGVGASSLPRVRTGNSLRETSRTSYRSWAESTMYWIYSVWPPRARYRSRVNLRVAVRGDSSTTRRNQRCRLATPIGSRSRS